MATIRQPAIVERHVEETDSSDASGMWIVALLLILIVAGFALFLARAYPFNFSTAPATGTPQQYDINVNVPKVSPPPATNTAPQPAK